jgi:acetolactate synthase small subunit
MYQSVSLSSRSRAFSDRGTIQVLVAWWVQRSDKRSRMTKVVSGRKRVVQQAAKRLVDWGNERVVGAN